MKKSDFEELSAPRQIMFLVEQAGVKWDAEGVEELPEMMVYGSGSSEYSVRTTTVKMTYEQGREAVRLLRLIPEIRKLADKHQGGSGSVSLASRLCAIHDLLSGAKP